MGKRILIVATSDIHLQVFHLPYFKLLESQGCVIDVAVEVRGDGIVPHTHNTFNLPFKRTLFTTQLFSAYKQLKNIIDKGKYDIIHCHTPIPSAITRLAARGARKKGTIVMYTSHGFHFYKGGPLLSWLLFYSVEKYLSRYTDVLITINKEDYDVAEQDFRAGKTRYMRGIGIDTSRFDHTELGDKAPLKRSAGYSPDSFILLYAANFIKRKNHIFVLKALLELRNFIPTVKVLFAGSGVLLQDMKDFVAKHGLSDHVEFLGFRKDIDQLLAITDLSISASKHEGLGLALAEAMFCRIPVVATEDRGHKEMIEHNVNGFLFEQENIQQFINYVSKLYIDRNLARTFGDRSAEKMKLFSIENSLAFMDQVYGEYLDK
ncbi:glycosyltransferase family 4 protein [Desertivirga arenae]|uniref:glycosyltransferase family 4 protein n=1 Tax=Desertivirga arenae TaxID=2810309 RepID=UPI001A963F73